MECLICEIFWNESDLVFIEIANKTSTQNGIGRFFFTITQMCPEMRVNIVLHLNSKLALAKRTKPTKTTLYAQQDSQLDCVQNNKKKLSAMRLCYTMPC